MLTFESSYNLQHGVSIFSMLWQIVILLSKFGSSSNSLFLVLSMLWNSSKSSFDVFFFSPRHFVWDSFILPSQPLCWFMSVSSPSRHSSGLHIRSVNSPTLLLLILNSHPIFISLPALLLFVSLLQFHLCWPVPSIVHPALWNVMWLPSGQRGCPQFLATRIPTT